MGSLAHLFARLLHPGRLFWVKLFGMVIASAAFALVVGPLVRTDPQVAVAIRQLLLPAAMLVLVLLVAVRHERRWRAATAVMRETVHQVRMGTASTSQLHEQQAANPELAALAEEVFRLARDLREQQRQVRHFEAECAHRVICRTDELEREIGTLRRKAHRDGLTDLNNRGSFEELFPAMVHRAREARRDLSAIMIDVDHFKLLNDTLGHAAGDNMLRDIGRLIRGAVRENDAAFRYGGDEFVLVLDGASQVQARATADRLTRLFDAMTRPLALPRQPRLSCGVASLADHPGATELLKAADAEAYRVKQARKAGRAA